MSKLDTVNYFQRIDKNNFIAIPIKITLKNLKQKNLPQGEVFSWWWIGY